MGVPQDNEYEGQGNLMLEALAWDGWFGGVEDLMWHGWYMPRHRYYDEACLVQVDICTGLRSALVEGSRKTATVLSGIKEAEVTC